MGLQLLINLIDAVKFILKLLGVYNDPTTKAED